MQNSFFARVETYSFISVFFAENSKFEVYERDSRSSRPPAAHGAAALAVAGDGRAAGAKAAASGGVRQGA